LRRRARHRNGDVTKTGAGTLTRRGPLYRVSWSADDEAHIVGVDVRVAL